MPRTIGDLKAIVADHMPIEGFSNVGQHPVRHNRSVFPGDVGQHRLDVRPLEFVDRFFAYPGANMPVERSFDLVSTAQGVRSPDILPQEIVEHEVDRVCRSQLGPRRFCPGKLYFRGGITTVCDFAGALLGEISRLFGGNRAMKP